MSNNELVDFERSVQRRLSEYLAPEGPRRQSSPSLPVSPGITVILAVQMKQLALDEHFVYHSSTISRLQARVEASKAARQAGWKFINHVVDYIQR